VRVAERAAAIRADLRRQRRPLTHRALDLLIAATAIEHGAPLASRNTPDYADIPGLLLVQPTWPPADRRYGNALTIAPSAITATPLM
jgi:hypothetical protein